MTTPGSVEKMTKFTTKATPTIKYPNLYKGTLTLDTVSSCIYSKISLPPLLLLVTLLLSVPEVAMVKSSPGEYAENKRPYN